MRAHRLDRAEIMDRAGHLYSVSRKLAKKGQTRANTFIHKKPVWSTLLGVGAGVLLGMILRRGD